MYRIYDALIELLAASVFIVPAFYIWNKRILHDGKRTVLYVVFGLYAAAVLALVGFPQITSLRMDITVHWIPFVGMTGDFVNTCLNVLLFVPFGFFLPVLWSTFRTIKKTVWMGAITTGIIELSQIFTFRATDINDIMTNIAGTVIGYCIARWLTKGFTKYIVSDSKSREFYIICGLIVVVMFFLQPFPASVLWGLIL